MSDARAWTAAEIRALGVRTDLGTAASVWGFGRTRGYELARAGEFPCQVIRVGNRYVVPVEPMLRALGVPDDAPHEPLRPITHDGSLAETESEAGATHGVGLGNVLPVTQGARRAHSHPTPPT